MSKKLSLLLIMVFAAVSMTACSALKTGTTTTASPLPTPAAQTATTPTPAAMLKTSYELTATQSGEVALDILEANAKVETKDYGEAGKFVTAINGLAGDNTAYWAFYVNGTYAEKGASQTKLKKGDTIKFVYEAVNAADALSK